MSAITDALITLLPIVMGAAFGALLHRGRVTSGHVVADIVRGRDYAAVKLFGAAVVVGGFGVLALVDLGQAHYLPKDADLLGVILGAVLFAVGLVLLGYCPGTAVAAAATGSLHALAGVAGMIAGAILFASSYGWIAAHILPVWAFGKIRLPDVTPIPGPVWLILMTGAAAMLVHRIERRAPRDRPGCPTLRRPAG